MAGEPPTIPEPLPVVGLRLGVPQRYVMNDLDAPVASAFQNALSRLANAGAKLQFFPFSELEELPGINAKGGFAPPEAYALHRKLIEAKGDLFDPLVLSRIKRGADLAAADYVDLGHARADLIRRAHRVTSPFDAVVMPTCAIVAPTLAEVSTPEGFMARNMLLLRNTALGNFLDRCALTIPIHEPGTAPVGLMLMGEHGDDRRLVQIGLGAESVLRRQ
jgi:aspartyl-tRNA(Asn)/glutamyl-tRNA(Gln) amidotransferase subunit A